ncbi:MAG: tRNA (adenosine(37)-N6)-threonylcarbamoyltransferase complex dimerization subunit type 1 TsaB [Candidatus Babeliales bacterium]
MIDFLAMQTTYDHLEIGLVHDTEIIDNITEDKKKASSLIILCIEELLKKNNRSLDDLSFIATNQGPAPFTSLRVVIATANGLSFASQLPLVGVDGLLGLFEEYTSNDWPYTVALLNAFNNDIYFGIQQPHKPIETGYENIEVFISRLSAQLETNKIRFIGNGAALFKDHIYKVFEERAFFPEPLPFYVSLKQLAQQAFYKWQEKKISYQLLPLYLKQLRYKKSISI